MIKLGPIQMVEPKRLKRNPKNEKFFKTESKQYFDILRDDIRARGILDPLVSRRDGMLLAGHNRLTIAEEQKIKTVPVRYVENNLTDAEETAFIIKDNTHRRHLSYGERMRLYKKLIKNFNKRILEHGKLGLSNQDIASATGLNPATINYDLIRARYNRKKELAVKAPDAPNEKAVYIFKRAVARMLNIAIIDKKSTLAEFLKLVQHAEKQLTAMLDNKQAIDMSRIQRRRLR